jgi:hypothetical protein
MRIPIWERDIDRPVGYKLFHNPAETVFQAISTYYRYEQKIDLVIHYHVGIIRNFVPDLKNENDII